MGSSVFVVIKRLVAPLGSMKCPLLFHINGILHSARENWVRTFGKGQTKSIIESQCSMQLEHRKRTNELCLMLKIVAPSFASILARDSDSTTYSSCIIHVEISM